MSPAFCLYPKPSSLPTSRIRCCTTCPSTTSPQQATTPTPLTPVTFRSRTIYIKRDDLLTFSGVSGSKYRKFYSLFHPEALQSYSYIISYGGSQSNAMLSLAALCKQHDKRFVYITKPLPPRLRNAQGNFNVACDLGMTYIPIDHDSYRTTFTDTNPALVEQQAIKLLLKRRLIDPMETCLFIPQGGAWEGAEPGISHLAEELMHQMDQLRRDNLLHSHRKPIIFLPSGTGTTAFYLQKHLGQFARVVTVPVSGDERYLIKQMKWLADRHSKTDSLEAPLFPDVLRPRLSGSFADIRKEKLAIWKELQRAANGQFDFDLIYAPKAWEEVMLALDEGRLGSNQEDILYYHTGGVEGNVSMLGKFVPLQSVFCQNLARQNSCLTVLLFIVPCNPE